MKIVLGCVHGQEIDGWFFHSMLGLATHIRKHVNNVESVEHLDQDDYAVVRSGPALALGRGMLVGSFLKDTDGDALVMLDADMSFTPDTIVEMVNAFTKMREEHDNVGMLGGLAFIMGDPRADNPKPNLWRLNPERPDHPVQLDTYQPDMLHEVAATGAACVIIHREVLERLSQDGNPFHHVPLVNWHMLAREMSQLEDVDKIESVLRQHVLNADQLGEDLSFCQRVRDAGYRIFVHTGLRFDHAKSTLIGEREFLASRPLVPVARIPAPPPALEAQPA